ncbi:MAG: TonB-dependent receptor [Parvularculaceae bacterium]
MKKLVLFTALTGGVLAGNAFAQDIQNASARKDEIVVTAQRREQSPQDVGVALNAFTGEDLLAQGVDKVNGLENISPGLEIENQFGSGQPSFSIRGVGFRDYATNNAPTVGVYVDDVAYPIPAMTQGVIYDVERVEVLRGPQGTLYGRNTTGGAIKIISAQPTDELAAGLTVEGGRFGRVDAQGFVSGPVTDSIRVRLSGATAQGGDWQVNRETGEKIGAAEQYALRGLVAVDIAPEVEALFNLHGFIDKSDGLGLQLFNDSSFGPLAHTGRETSYGSSDEFSALTGIAEDAHPFRDSNGWGANLTLNAGLGETMLTYIGAYEVLDRKEFNDYDALALGAAGVYFESSADVMSHELRLAGDAEKLHWVGGVYYSEEDLNELYQSDFVVSFGPGFAVTTPYKQHVRTMAAYIHGDYALTNTLSLVAGLRYEDEERKLRDLGTFAVGLGPFNFANGTVDGTLENRDLNSDNVSGKIGLDYRPSDDLLLYVSFSRGVKSGGFTAYNTLNPNAINPFAPESSTPMRRASSRTTATYSSSTAPSSITAIAISRCSRRSTIPAPSAVVGRIVNAPKSEIVGGERGDPRARDLAHHRPVARLQGRRVQGIRRSRHRRDGDGRHGGDDRPLRSGSRRPESFLSGIRRSDGAGLRRISPRVCASIIRIATRFRCRCSAPPTPSTTTGSSTRSSRSGPITAAGKSRSGAATSSTRTMTRRAISSSPAARPTLRRPACRRPMAQD